MKITPSSVQEWLAAAAAAATALLLYAAFPPGEWTWAAAVALIPLLVMARRSPLPQVIRLSYVAGLLFWLLNIRWLTNVTIIGWLLLSAYCALYFVPAGLLAHQWRGGALGFAASLAVVWSGWEWIRGWLGTGFPWNPLGVALAPWLPGIQLAEVGGVWLVSGLVVFINALAAWAVVERRNWRAVLAGALAVAAALGWGLWRVRYVERLFPADPAKPAAGAAGAHRWLRVALVQPAIPQDDKWSRAKIEMIYSRLRNLTRQAQQDPAVELVIWPETALPDDVRHSEESYALVWSLCTNGTPILTGSLDTALLDSQTPAYFNSAFLFETDGRLAGEYDKRHLVLLGEYVPLEGILPSRWLLAAGVPASITPGRKSAVFRAGPANIPMAPLICFEDILPYLARADVRAGARMLVNLTNDAWFDEHMAPWQHMRNGTLRAVEHRVPLVRAANTGVSCVIHPSGRILALLADESGRTSRPGILPATVPVPDDLAPLTLYARLGDIYGVACAVAAALWLAQTARLQRCKPPSL